MTALTMERMRSFERWTYHQMILTSGTKAWKHGIAMLDPATGKVKPGAAGTGLLFIGLFAENVDATAGDKLVNINFGTEKEIEWLANAATGPVLATDVGKVCYVLDDQTVTITSTGNSVAGRVWIVDAVQGVGVERIAAAPAAALTAAESGGGEPIAEPEPEPPVDSGSPPETPIGGDPGFASEFPLADGSEGDATSEHHSGHGRRKR
jgi:hypothetical protein